MHNFLCFFLLNTTFFCNFVPIIKKVINNKKTITTMRFTLSSSALSGKLTALSRVINSKNALPILGDFVFEIKDNVLYLTASDSENMMKTQIDLTESDGYCRFAIGNHDLLEMPTSSPWPSPSATSPHRLSCPTSYWLRTSIAPSSLRHRTSCAP